ncbi:MAG: alpha/beta fold hydrolase [Prochlorothrix sp.]
MTALINTIQQWQWQGQSIAYEQAGEAGPALVLIHGFGASSFHWRKNLAVLGQTHRVYAVDLLGFGRSAKPTPNQPLSYTFETWGQQILDFCRDIVQGPAFLVGNSIGCIVALQAAVTQPKTIQGLVLLNCSLRLLHDRKRQALPWYRSVGTPIIQSLLGIKPIGQSFFQSLAKAKVVDRVLRQAYGRKAEVTPELVEALVEPSRDPGAVEVFLAFVRYSQGPLPEDLLPQVSCPVLVLWGAEDPWEPIDLGRALAAVPQVEHFIPLPGVGHCPQDEAPELVNPLVRDWTLKKARSRSPFWELAPRT